MQGISFRSNSHARLPFPRTHLGRQRMRYRFLSGRTAHRTGGEGELGRWAACGSGPASAPPPTRVCRSHVLTWGGSEGDIAFCPGAQPTGQARKKNREDGQLSAPVPASAPISAHVIGPADPLRTKTVADMLPVRVRRSSGRETESGNREGGQLQSCPPS